MIAAVAIWLTKQLGRYVYMTEEEAEVYQYGFDIALYTVLSTAALLFIGVVIGDFVTTVICVSLFYLNQTFGGGYHANTHLGCFATMVLGLVFYYSLLSLEFPSGIYCYVGLISLVVLMIKPLVLHKNKRYLESNRKQFELRSRLILMLEALIFGLLFFNHQERLLPAFSLSLLLCAASRIAAWIISHKETTT